MANVLRPSVRNPMPTRVAQRRLRSLRRKHFLLEAHLFKRIMQAHHACMNSRHRKTLMKVFTDPVSGTIAWDAVEALLVAAGCVVIEGTGSRVRFAFGPEGEHVETFHRPHPEKEAKRYQIKAARAFLTKIGAAPAGAPSMSEEGSGG